MLKDSVARFRDLAAAVRRVAAGGTVVDPAIVEQLLQRRGVRDQLGGLSPGERAVLEMMAEGLSNRGIAAGLIVSERTVEAHTRSILSKLDISVEVEVNRRVRAVLAYMRASAST